MTKSKVYLVWLEWPEACFKASARAVNGLRALVSESARVIRVRSERAFLRHLPEATHAVVWNFKAEWFSKALRLEVLATPAAGRELVPEQVPSGVRIHFGHFHGPIIAETVAAFILAWARGFFALASHEKSGAADARWARTWLSDKCREVAGTSAVIYGYGNIGKAIGAKLAALGVRVTGVTRHQPAQAKALAEADWFILALPSTTGTDGIFNTRLIRKLPRKCVIVNIGRGNAIDEAALARALESGRLAGAYLDVRRNEPSGTVPYFGENVSGLEKLGNCILSPHSSAFSPDYLAACFKELADDGCL